MQEDEYAQIVVVILCRQADVVKADRQRHAVRSWLQWLHLFLILLRRKNISKSRSSPK